MKDMHDIDGHDMVDLGQVVGLNVQMESLDSLASTAVQ